MPCESPKNKLHYGEIFSSQEKTLLSQFVEPLGVTINIESARDVDLMEICAYIARKFSVSGVKLGGEIGDILDKSEMAKEQLTGDIESLTIPDLPVEEGERLPDYIVRCLNGKSNFPEDIRITIAKLESVSVLRRDLELKELDPDDYEDIASLDEWEKMMASMSYYSQIALSAKDSGDETMKNCTDSKNSWKSYYLANLTKRGVVRSKEDAEMIEKLQASNAASLDDVSKP